MEFTTFETDLDKIVAEACANGGLQPPIHMVAVSTDGSMFCGTWCDVGDQLHFEQHFARVLGRISPPIYFTLVDRFGTSARFEPGKGLPRLSIIEGDDDGDQG